jgi:hypothetical protein
METLVSPGAYVDDSPTPRISLVKDCDNGFTTAVLYRFGRTVESITSGPGGGWNEKQMVPS